MTPASFAWLDKLVFFFFFHKGMISSFDLRSLLVADVAHRRQLISVDSSIEPSTTESFVLDDVEYKLCRYHVTWDEALVFCSSHKAHLAVLDTEEKTAFVVQAIASSNSGGSNKFT